MRTARVRLAAELEALEAQATEIRSQGLTLDGVILDGSVTTTKARGTAGQPSQQKDYYQFRSKDPIFIGRNGAASRTRYLKPDEVSRYLEVSDRVRRLRKLEKRISQLKGMLA